MSPTLACSLRSLLIRTWWCSNPVPIITPFPLPGRGQPLAIARNRDPQPADHTPPVSEGRASGAALRAPSPPSGRGVCLIFSSSLGPLTTMTGSELAGHRLLGSARRVVLRTTLIARRGGPEPPLKRPPPPGAPRLLPPPRGAGSPWR